MGKRKENEKIVKIIKVMKKLINLKDCLEYLKQNYKYVRTIELHNTMMLETVLFDEKISFKKFILASNELEEYEKSEIEVENIKVVVNTVNTEMKLFEVFWDSDVYIPVFLLKLKEEKDIFIEKHEKGVKSGNTK